MVFAEPKFRDDPDLKVKLLLPHMGSWKLGKFIIFIIFRITFNLPLTSQVLLRDSIGPPSNTEWPKIWPSDCDRQSALFQIGTPDDEVICQWVKSEGRKACIA